MSADLANLKALVQATFGYLCVYTGYLLNQSATSHIERAKAKGTDKPFTKYDRQDPLATERRASGRGVS